MRHGGLLVLIIKGYVEGTNCREKPRMKYIKQIMKDQRCNSYEETKRKVSNKGRVENCYKPISGLNTKERERRLQRSLYLENDKRAKNYCPPPSG